MLRFQNWDHLLQFDASSLYEEEVRMFYQTLEISANGVYLTFLVNGMKIGLDEEILSEILCVQTLGTKCIKSRKGSTGVLKLCGALDVSHPESFDERVIKSDFELLCQLLTSTLLRSPDKETTLTSADLFLMEMFKYKKVNLSAIVITHLSTFSNANADRDGLPYGF